ncbi:extracellular calcium-sensing receptor-like [Ambystoma mexicanum]|uniref:extracellular calcium-sensing receptor-like n=1 Tax=Ambystoma mexicanum TaxID=8296 RepID=UPI0037E8253C
MILQKHERKNTDFKWYLGQKKIEIVKSFKYLGVHLDSSQHEKTMQHELQTKINKLAAQAKVIDNKFGKCSMLPIINFYRMKVVPAVTYGTEAMPTIPKQIWTKPEASFWRQVLKLLNSTSGVAIRRELSLQSLECTISYFSTLPLLSDRNQFPSFFRTIPSDDFQFCGLAQLMMHFDWTWIGLLAADNDYGQNGLQILKAELHKAGACVAFSENIILSRADRNAKRIVQVIGNSTANAIAILSLDSHLIPLFDEMVKWNITGKVFIASEAWSMSALLSVDKYVPILSGTIGFAIHSGKMPGFNEYLNSVRPSNFSDNIFFKDFWEAAFTCTWQDPEILQGSWNNQGTPCRGDERMDHVNGFDNDVTSPRVTYNVYRAVYAIALALHDLNLCRATSGPFHHGTCANISDFKPWQMLKIAEENERGSAESEMLWAGENGAALQLEYDACRKNVPSGSESAVFEKGSGRRLNAGLQAQCGIRRCGLLKDKASGDNQKYTSITSIAIPYLSLLQLLHYMKNVQLQSKDGVAAFFDGSGNPVAQYDIVQWQLAADGKIQHRMVGRYDFSTPSGKSLQINTSALQWVHTGQVPRSVCSPSCSHGFRKASKQGAPLCCFQCISCPPGEISNETGSIECSKCPIDHWSNVIQDQCILKTEEFLAYEDTLGATLAATTICLSLIPVVILGLFFHYRNTPIVKANNRSLSYILLLSLTLCFLSSLAFIGYPTSEKCLLRQAAFGINFSLCVSCILGKTIMVVIAFNATKPNSELRRWTRPQISYKVIGVCTLIQCLICTSWLIISPPFSEHNIHTEPGKIIVECNEGSPIGFWCMLGYLGLLSTICFIVAFLARKLPDSFNEAKFITFSMLAFLSVWLSFIPAYLSAHGRYSVAMESFAILISSSAMVSCLFLPKCYIILVKSERNTKEYLMRKDLR